MSDKDKRCGLCEHFNRAQGMFGQCIKTSKVAFAGDAACGKFSERAAAPTKMADFGGRRAIINPFNSFADLFSGMFMPSTPMKDSGSDYKSKKPWQNPLYKRKREVRKVISFKEAAAKIHRRKKLTKGGL